MDFPGLGHESHDDPRDGGFDFHTWQLAVSGARDAELASKVEILGRKGAKSTRSLIAAKRDFFSLLIARDQAGLEELILMDAKLPNHDATTGGFYTYFATLEAKVCWHRGIEIDIPHPRVPMDLIKLSPLPKYDDEYEFLRPGWTPPPDKLIHKLLRMWKR